MFVALHVWFLYLLMSNLMLKTRFMEPMLERMANENQTHAIDPASPAPANHEFTTRPLETREDYWTTDIIYQNTTPATDNIAQNLSLAIERPLHDYL